MSTDLTTEPVLAKIAPSPAARASLSSQAGAAEIILSFDVEEHYRIEAAVGLDIDPGLKSRHGERVGPTTCWLLDRLEARGIKATFFVLGQIADRDPALVRRIHDAGHEVASHGWDHRRVLEMTPTTFREDLRLSKEALETSHRRRGRRLPGARPSASSRRTAWALDVLAEMGMLYDSSIYPVRHDRYGVPEPRAAVPGPGLASEICSRFPRRRSRLLGVNVPAGGGGYFRLFPLAVMEHALRQVGRSGRPAGGHALLPPLGIRPRPAPPAARPPQPVSHLRRDPTEPRTA